MGIIIGLTVTQHSDAQSSSGTEAAARTMQGESIIGTLEKYVSVVAGVAEIGVVILLYKTVKDFAELAKVSKLQTEVRFRPWIGPSSTISKINDDGLDNKQKYAIALKNFGEVPSSTVVAMSSVSVTLPTREIFSNGSVIKFNLGPLLPNMEKKYWIFVDQDLVSKTQEGKSDIFVALYFSYEYPGGKSAYGMISQFDNKNNSFIHRDMWLE
jgi:hypothetical protein